MRLLAIAVLLGLSHGAPAQDIDSGRVLHEQHCLRCHGPEIYQSSQSLITDLDALRQRVNHCELGQELSWFPEEVDDVVAYLNAMYYHLGEEQGDGRE